MSANPVALTPFTWEPPEGDGPIFASLLDGDEYVCPWPECGHRSPAPQGIGRHMSATHGWKSPLPTRPPSASAKERISDARRHRKVEQITCGLDMNGERCGRKIRRDYLRGHLKQFHGLSDMDIPDAIAHMQVRVTNNKPRGRPPKAAQAELALTPLSAADICQAVLLELSPNGSLPISAIPAYQLWVAQTEAFLSLLMS